MISTPKINNAYLGPKGYTIYKSDLSQSSLNKIKEDLTVRPKVIGGCDANCSFPAYRESANKMYVPHYYGIKHFGELAETKIKEGTSIQLEFNGGLRPSQTTMVTAYITHVLQKGYGGGLLELNCGGGKTVCGLNIISRLKTKTLIIVHKEFLMNQWIERINQFLPGAKIGKIQGKIIDIENKDIVLGMLQSLSMKDYPSSTFESFGLTIIDEVHHISSEVFSRTLFKLVTRFMLGLSATMNRKDGTTYIFKMFLGEVIYKGEREEKHNVEVRAIDYFVDDDEFNKVVYDYKGNAQYSSMISKLCTYNHRSEFILKVITDLLCEDNTQQIMVLAHNKNLLTYLYDSISSRTIASVGYYVGGMKERDLKETESKQIVIATYSMAAEALDIKSLTTLIMATPKTDIEQSVGRILREKHASPRVIDIIDSHTNFKNQWKKRKTFYIKENYKIVHTTNKLYMSNAPKTSIWKTQHDPNKYNVCNDDEDDLHNTRISQIDHHHFFNKIKSSIKTAPAV
jgi:superfamily II DNA or RNA helicase